MKFIPTIQKKIEHAQAIWFEKTGSFVLLEEPAYYVFKNFRKGHNLDALKKECKTRYGGIEKETSRFVDEIIGQLEFLNNPKNAENNALARPRNLKTPNSFYAIKTYRVAQNTFRINYQTEYTLNSIQLLIAHLEIESSAGVNQEAELLDENGILSIVRNGKWLKSFKQENSEFFAGGALQLLYSIIHNKNFNSWNLTTHASGIEKNNKAILFSADSGCGKSTIAALLHSQGYNLLSDDIIAMDECGNAYGIPTAISVKPSAVPVLKKHYPTLKDLTTKTSFAGKRVQYLPVENTSLSGKGIPVHAFVFVKYSTDEPFVFDRVNKKKALQNLLRQSWINPQKDKVNSFLNWFEYTDFFRLTYSKTEQALDIVNNLICQR